MLNNIFMGGVIGAGVGFLLGFVGPLIFYPENNIGPLASFVTTPIGLFFGMLIGALIYQKPREEEKDV